MRHLKQGRKLGRTTAHRKALLRNLATALFEHERIVTTEPKAKELRRIADKLVTLGKRGNLHARRQALQVVRSNAVVRKLFNEVAPRFAGRQGGYTRILRLGYRPGDAAAMAVIELVDAQVEEAPGGR
jgi:large subunit ribosomal protein L17